MDRVLATMAELAGWFGADMIQATGRAERAEDEVIRLRAALALAEAYIQDWAERGDAGARSTLEATAMMRKGTA
jgi:hypothetical protein